MLLPSRRCNRGNLLLWSLRSLPAPSGNHIYPFISPLSGLWQFLLSTSRPRCPHCSGSDAVSVLSVLCSNRINIQMSAAPLSPAPTLSSLKLHWSAFLSTSSLFQSPCCPSLLSRSLRSPLSPSSPVSMLPFFVSSPLARSGFTLDPLTCNL